ncbi:MAG: hypothetical protein A2445_02575 [Candidatus Jacksonbacteria bacterium RIFOXYC2_FULL_44_29]|nr:MAG: hypothetical protein UV19_C0002G0019 [Parcubacteria group bacterium GW2011_GWA2_42_28]KKT55887.1 MAG: hypothetical protein UW45_C0003G0020 [Parcubacteria group bacterium GW2011_GWC2_44_22]OGY74501.1 MAG: hypothetical protein A2240_02830 [Candidatus Jacksonbacteria bacterium RIFOXYA2_FULL_43_12]OGY77410.1 MAG: hypothetical protein A2295_01780 [Candidatus Jacksonbacteria bacterium RIFOXYB2_FULL_44_15]OGY78182.1 MAG: hypothetical protein A2550_06125 [Candidatus Jacksonbacteria bacterium RI
MVFKIISIKYLDGDQVMSAEITIAVEAISIEGPKYLEDPKPLAMAKVVSEFVDNDPEMLAIVREHISNLIAGTEK